MELVLRDGKITSLEVVKQINMFRSEEGSRAELQHKTLLEIIRDEFEEEISQQNILPSTYTNERGREYTMFELTVSQAKQILVRESKFVRKAVIKRLEDLEKAVQKIYSYMIADPVKRAEAWILEEKARVELQDKIEADRSKVEFVDAITSTDECLLVREFSAVLGLKNFGQNKMFAWLRDNGYLMSNNESKNMPYRRYIEQGIFEVEEEFTGNGNLVKTTKITGKGQLFLEKKIREDLNGRNY